jgi:capsule polysaccharide export protein KpsE/RkpR
MTTIEEFIKAREAIEKLASQIIVLVEHKSVRESRKCLDDANQKLEVLSTMVANDIQVNVISRLTAQLGQFSAKIVRMEAKMPAGKRAAKKKPVKPEAPVKPAITETPEIVVFEH